MPCSDGGYSNYEETQNKQNHKQLEIMLCSACRVLARFDYNFDENPSLSTWWANHKKKDEERIEQEKIAAVKKILVSQMLDELMKRPLKSLTNEEKGFLRKHNII